MDLGIADRVAIVTGGSHGLGREAALALAREGVRVAICARGSENLAAVAGELRSLGVDALGVEADMTEESAAESVYERAAAALGPVDILVNNVGGGGGSNLEGTPPNLLARVFELNFFQAVRLTRLVLPGMRARRWGRIINISSIYGREWGGSLAYMSAKAALIAFSKHLALDAAKDRVLVNSVAPGSIIFPGGGWQRFVDGSPPEVVDEFIARNLPMGEFGWPQPVGDLVAFLASERASLLTGAAINIDGGQSRSLI